MAEERFNFKQNSAVKFPTQPRTGATTGEKVGTALALLQGLLSIGKNRKGRVRQTLTDIQQIGQQRRAREQTTFRNKMADAFREAALKTQKANTQFERRMAVVRETRLANKATNDAIQDREDAKAKADQLKITNDFQRTQLEIQASLAETRAAGVQTPEERQTIARGKRKLAIDKGYAAFVTEELKGGFKDEPSLTKQQYAAIFFPIDTAPINLNLQNIQGAAKKKVDENGKEVTSPSLEFAHKMKDEELIRLRNSDNPGERSLGEAIFILLQTEQRNNQNAVMKELGDTTKTTFRR